MLTSEVAYKYALADLNIVGERGFYSEKHIDLIYEFTPASINVTDDESAWNCVVLNYWFSLAMTQLNGHSALNLMDEAGVSQEGIAHAFKRSGGNSNINTHIPIAPPTYKADPLAWSARGYDVATEARKGDVVVRKNVAALYVSSGWMSVAAIGGFSYGKVEYNTLASCTLQVRRV